MTIVTNNINFGVFLNILLSQNSTKEPLKLKDALWIGILAKKVKSLMTFCLFKFYV